MNGPKNALARRGRSPGLGYKPYRRTTTVPEVVVRPGFMHASTRGSPAAQTAKSGGVIGFTQARLGLQKGFASVRICLG
jgi:hypothetical protein